MVRPSTTVIVLVLFSKFTTQLGGIGTVFVVIGSIMTHRSNYDRVLRRGNHKQSTRRVIIQIVVGVGMILFGILLLYQSLTLQLPGAV